MSTYVKVTKLERLPDRPNGQLVAVDKTSEITEGYWLIGYTDRMPTIGERFVVERHNRNGVEALGEFSTSPVEAFDTHDSWIEIRTLNSVYRIDLLNP